jgi:hypothetical protein
MASKETIRSEKITTPVARLSFPNIWQPRVPDSGGDAKYSAVLIFPKGTDLSELKKAVVEVAKKFFKGKKPPANYRSPFRDNSQKENIPGYEEDGTFISCTSYNRPGVVDKKCVTITDPNELYPGCWVKATVVAFSYNKKGNVGISFGLNNLQKVKDGEPLGSWSRAEDDFEPITEEEEWEGEKKDDDADDGDDMYT